jgi:hypothetical protein
MKTGKMGALAIYLMVALGREPGSKTEDGETFFGRIIIPIVVLYSRRNEL